MVHFSTARFAAPKTVLSVIGNLGESLVHGEYEEYEDESSSDSDAIHESEEKSDTQAVCCTFTPLLALRLTRVMSQ